VGCLVVRYGPFSDAEGTPLEVLSGRNKKLESMREELEEAVAMWEVGIGAGALLGGGHVAPGSHPGALPHGTWWPPGALPTWHQGTWEVPWCRHWSTLQAPVYVCLLWGQTPTGVGRRGEEEEEEGADGGDDALCKTLRKAPGQRCTGAGPGGSRWGHDRGFSPPALLKSLSFTEGGGGATRRGPAPAQVHQQQLQHQQMEQQVQRQMQQQQVQQQQMEHSSFQQQHLQQQHLQQQHLQQQQIPEGLPSSSTSVLSSNLTQQAHIGAAPTLPAWWKCWC